MEEILADQKGRNTFSEGWASHKTETLRAAAPLPVAVGRLLRQTPCRHSGGHIHMAVFRCSRHFFRTPGWLHPPKGLGQPIIRDTTQPSHSILQPQRRELPHDEEEIVSNKSSDISHLEEAEALEHVEFDPSIDSWEPPQVIESFLDKHFNHSLRGELS